MNEFLKAVQKYDTITENGAISHSTTGDALVDYFSKCGTYRNRSFEEVSADISRCWAESPIMTMMIIFYMRMITRKTSGLFQSEAVQKGQGSRDEFRKALKWVLQRDPDAVYNNMWLIPVVGAWKDLWHKDLIGDLDSKRVHGLVQSGIYNPATRELVAKYLPRIRSASKMKNDHHTLLNKWTRTLCKTMGWSEKEYRKFKSHPSNTAHQFQRIMSAGQWDNLDFSKIPGKALFNLVSKKDKEGLTAIERHGILNRYVKWIRSQPVAKFTGYVYELFHALSGGYLHSYGDGIKATLAQKLTYDRQFDGLIELAKKDRGGIKGNVWCALDTSGSMASSVVGEITAYDICVSLGIYFSALNTSVFKDHVIMFDDVSRVMKLAGTFCDKANQIISANTAWGSTNFQSVIDEICRVRQQNPKVPISHYPETLLVVSDMQFNPAGGNSQTNYELAMKKLEAFGLPRINIIWWWVTGRGGDFPSTIEDEGVTMIGGFDGAVVSLILGGEMETVDEKTGKVRKLNAYENMLKALDQEVLRQLRV